MERFDAMYKSKLLHKFNGRRLVNSFSKVAQEFLGAMLCQRLAEDVTAKQNKNLDLDLSGSFLKMPRETPTRTENRRRRQLSVKAGANYPSTLPIPPRNAIAMERPVSRMEAEEMWTDARLRAEGRPPIHRRADWLQGQLQPKKKHARRRVALERLRILRGLPDAGSMHTSDPSDAARTTDDLEEEADLRESQGRFWHDLLGYL
jgi:hypothetical protein